MSDENGICYIDTQNLDGETNLKERHYPRGLKLPSGPEFRYRYPSLMDPTVFLLSRMNHFF